MVSSTESKDQKDSNGKDTKVKDSNGKDTKGKDSKGKNSRGKNSKGKNSKGKEPKVVEDPVETLEAVANLIRDAKNIVVITGAGLSVSAGIPDFRSAAGFYNNPPEYLKQYKLGDPSDIFNITYFRKNPLPFYHFAKVFTKDEHHPTIAHHFIQELNRQGKLRRYYTQNVDGLDEKTGNYEDKMIYCHGSFSSSKCIDCEEPYDVNLIKEMFKGEEIVIPRCPNCNGLVKPDIVFFGESMPSEFHEAVAKDFNAKGKIDLLIVIGTSLTVMPVAYLPTLLPKSVPRVLINRDRASSFDHYLDGDLQATCLELYKRLGWSTDNFDSKLLKKLSSLKVSDE